MATLVKFRYNDKENDLFAYFPQLNYNKLFFGTENKVGYSHLGQHTHVCVDYANNCRPATEAEYLPLKQELESIGYTLKVCK